MSRPVSREEEIFLAVFEHLPRQGPGNRSCAEKALALCRALPGSPSVVDLGCGAGSQTLHLAAVLNGPIVALDIHEPFIRRLRSEIDARGLSGRVRAEVGDLARPGLPPGGFDLAWSEGAFYNVGIEAALGACRRLLRPGGYLAFSDAVWLSPDPSAGARELFAEYPDMGRVEDILALASGSGFESIGHFPLPDEAWWDDFYTPMLRRIDELRVHYAGDPQALSILEAVGREPARHRLHSSQYAYEFFVLRRLPGPDG